MASNTSGGKLISPWDQKIYDVPADKQETYRAAGWVPPLSGNEIDADEVHGSFNKWAEMGRGEAALYSTSHGFLGLPWAVTHAADAVGHHDWAESYANHVMQAETQYPTQDAVLRLGAGVGSAIGYGALAAAAAPALGLGAVAGGAAAGLGEAVAAGGEAASAAEAAIGAVPEAGQVAATLGQRALNYAPTAAKELGKLGLESAAIGVVNRYDQAAIQHAYAPDGREKVVWALSDVGLDFAVGVGGGAALKGVGKLVGGAGRKLMGISTDAMANALTDAESAEQAALNGRDGELRRMVKEVLPLGLQRGRTRASNLISQYEKDMNQLKFNLEGKGNYLDVKKVDELMQEIHQTLGGTKEGDDLMKMLHEMRGGSAPGVTVNNAETYSYLDSEAAKARGKEQAAARGANAEATEAAATENASRAKGDAATDEVFNYLDSEAAKAKATAAGAQKPMDRQAYQTMFGREPPPGYYDAKVGAGAPARPGSSGRVTAKQGAVPGDFVAPGVDNAKYNYTTNPRPPPGTQGDPPGAINVQRLQELRRAAYDMVNWKDPQSRPVNQSIKSLGKSLGDKIGELFQNADNSGGTQYAQQWKLLDERYSSAQLLSNALRSGNDNAGLMAVFSGLGRAAAIGMALGTTGFMGGPIAAAKASASYKAIQTVKPQHFHELGAAMGAVANWADRKVADKVLAKLRGLPSTYRNYVSPAAYQDMAQKVAMVAQDPVTAFSNLNENLVAAGVPPDIARDTASSLHQRNIFLSEQLEQARIGPADVVSTGHGDRVTRRKVHGQWEVMKDPTHALEYPTQANLEVLKKFYPETLFTAQAAIYSQIRKNPHLSTASKLWASRVLGRPVQNLASPSFYQKLQQARAQSDQQAQQAASPRGTGRGKAVQSGQSSGTRLDELRGGGE